MATESVDELDEVLRLYQAWLNKTEPGNFWEQVPEAKKLLDAYIARECARKVLEGRIDTAQTALRACPTQDDKLRKWLEQHIVSLRAAIQEMEGK